MTKAKQPVSQVFINNLRALMEMRGDTTYSLADRSGVPQATISRIILDRNKISLDNADKLAGAYGLDGWYLLLPNLNAATEGHKK